ncbi:MAG: O-methyltransferase [Planctomycetota bacterium]
MKPLTRGAGMLVTVLVAAVAADAQRQDPQGGAARPSGPPGSEAFVERAMRFDADGDGKLSEAELTKMAASFRAERPVGERETRDASRRQRSRPGPDDRGDPGNPARPPMAGSDAEARILAVLADMRRGRGYANVSSVDGRFLRLLTEAVGARRVVEIGTSNGYSATWFALALRTTGGRLYTHEIDPERIRMARENFAEAGVAEIVTVIAGDAHDTVKQHTEPIDILFLDADKQGYVDYLEKLLPLVRPGGLILAHNMRRPSPDPRYIEAITTNPDLDTMFVLMDGAGISVTIKKRSE